MIWLPIQICQLTHIAINTQSLLPSLSGWSNYPTLCYTFSGGNIICFPGLPTYHLKSPPTIYWIWCLVFTTYIYWWVASFYHPVHHSTFNITFEIFMSPIPHSLPDICYNCCRQNTVAILLIHHPPLYCAASISPILNAVCNISHHSWWEIT